MLCKTCGQEMAILFNGFYCKSHCDLPADKAAVARKKDQDAKPVSTTPPVGKVPAGNGPTATSTGNGSVIRHPPCPVCSANSTYIVNGLYHCGAIFCSHRWSPPIVAANVDPSWWNGPLTINWGGQPVRVIADPDCPVDKPYFLCNPKQFAIVADEIRRAQDVCARPRLWVEGLADSERVIEYRGGNDGTGGGNHPPVRGRGSHYGHPGRD